MWSWDGSTTKTLDDFYFSFQPSIDKRQIDGQDYPKNCVNLGYGEE